MRLIGEMAPVCASRVVHLELHTRDSQAAGGFCSELFGWRKDLIETPHGSYQGLGLSGGIGGGIVQCPTAHPLWLPYVEVDDIVEMTHRATLLGARVMLCPREGPAGWRSVVATPAAGEIALWQPKRAD